MPHLAQMHASLDPAAACMVEPALISTALPARLSMRPAQPCRLHAGAAPAAAALPSPYGSPQKGEFFAAYHAGTVQGIIGRTGFSPTEAFRKYLWFALRERKFDQDAVDDLVQLKMSLRLQDSEVGWVTQCSGKACRNFLYVQSALDCA